MNVFHLLLSHLVGAEKANAVEAKLDRLEKDEAPVLVPLEAEAAKAIGAAVSSAIDHNTAFAAQEISLGFDKIGLAGVDRTLAEAVVTAGLEHITVAVTPQNVTGEISRFTNSSFTGLESNQ